MKFVRSMNKTTKQIILGIKMVVFAILGWFFLYQIFYSDVTILLLILTILFLIIWVITISIGALLMNNRFLYLFFILSLLSFLIFFNGADLGPGQLRQALYYLMVIFLIFIAFMVYRHKVKSEQSLRTKLKFFKILKRGLPLVLTMVCLLIALAYYFSPALGQIDSNGPGISKDDFNLIVSPFKNLISSRMPEQTNDDKKIEDYLYNFANEKLSTSPVISEAVPIVLAISLFFVLRLVLIIIIPIILLLSCLIIKLLLATNFASINKEKIEVERINI